MKSTVGNGTFWYDEGCKWDIYVYTRGGGYFTASNISLESAKVPTQPTIAVYAFADSTYGHEVF